MLGTQQLQCEVLRCFSLTQFCHLSTCHSGWCLQVDTPCFDSINAPSHITAVTPLVPLLGAMSKACQPSHSPPHRSIQMAVTTQPPVGHALQWPA